MKAGDPGVFVAGAALRGWGYATSSQPESVETTPRGPTNTRGPLPDPIRREITDVLLADRDLLRLSNRSLIIDVRRRFGVGYGSARRSVEAARVEASR